MFKISQNRFKGQTFYTLPGEEEEEEEEQPDHHQQPLPQRTQGQHNNVPTLTLIRLLKVLEVLVAHQLPEIEKDSECICQK